MLLFKCQDKIILPNFIKLNTETQNFSKKSPKFPEQNIRKKIVLIQFLHFSPHRYENE